MSFSRQARSALATVAAAGSCRVPLMGPAGPGLLGLVRTSPVPCMRLLREEAPLTPPSRAWHQEHSCHVRVRKGVPLPPRTVEVNPLTKAEMAWSKSYRNVPIAVVNGVQVNNSSDIINRVEDLLGGPPVGQGSMAASEVEEWCGWVDSTLAKTLAPNIYRTWDESLDSFAYISEHSNFGPLMGPVTKYTGAVLMYAISKRLKKKYGFQDEREALYSAVQQWLERGVADRRFAGGDTPNKADVEVFGVLRALEGYTTFRDLQENTRMAPWYAAMQEAVGPSAQQHALFTAPEQR